MKAPLTLLFASLVMVTSLSAAGAVAVAAERAQATHLLAFGRPATATELNGIGDQSGSVAKLLARYRTELESDAAARRGVAVRAFEDTFGRTATEANVTDAAHGLYTDIVRQQLDRLAQSPDEYRRVIDRAYQLAIHRPAFDIEVAYWRERPVLPYVLLVGCIEGWARRNAPGLMATTGNPCLGVNSALVRTLSVSPAVAAELRGALGLQPAEGEALAIAAGHNVVAPGASDVGSLGGMFIVVVGDHELVKG
jgi:hypothetical protein